MNDERSMHSRLREAEGDCLSKMSSLPEGCISHILSLTSPRDVCRCCAVSPIFRSAAESDAVWERFLPSDCAEIMAHFVSPLLFSSKKDLYFQLCRPTLIDEGTKSFWLEKSSGKKCFMLSAKDLSIFWSDDHRYMQWLNAPHASVFSEVAQLIMVFWFRVHGTINSALLSLGTSYAVHFILNHNADRYRWDEEHDHYCPPSVELFLHPHNDPNHHKRNILLLPDMEENALQPSLEFSGWRELEIGEFLCDEDGGEIDFGMEVDCFMQCISILGVAIRPVIPR